MGDVEWVINVECVNHKTTNVGQTLKAGVFFFPPVSDVFKVAPADEKSLKSTASLEGRGSFILFVFLLHRNKSVLIIYLLNTEDFVRTPRGLPEPIVLPSNSGGHDGRNG